MRKIVVAGSLSIIVMSSAHAGVMASISNFASSAKARVMSLFTTVPTEPGVTHFRNHTSDLLTIIYYGDSNPTITIQPNAEIALPDKGYHQLVSVNGVALSAFNVNQDMGTNAQFIFTHSVDANNNEFYDFSNTATVINQKYTNTGPAMKNIQNVQASNEQNINLLHQKRADLQNKIDDYDAAIVQTIANKKDLTTDTEYKKEIQKNIEAFVTDSVLAEHLQSRTNEEISKRRLNTNDYYVESFTALNEDNIDFVRVEMKHDRPINCGASVGKNNFYIYVDLTMPNARYLVSELATGYASAYPVTLRLKSQEFHDPVTDVSQVLCIAKQANVHQS